MGKDGERLWAKVVVYTFLERDGKILLGKRKNVWGEGMYSSPTGHVDAGERMIDAAKRELEEETGIAADEFEIICVGMVPEYSIGGKKADPYSCFALKAVGWEGEPRLTEPDRCYGWEWHSPLELPEPMFPPVKAIVDCMLKGEEFL